MAEWIPTSWRRRADPDTRLRADRITIDLMLSPFYTGERYAVRTDSRGVLNTSGEWEYEPIPSSRDDAFYERCRFKTFAEACAAAELASEAKG